VVVPKPKDLIRINCIGDSTTALHIGFGNDTYSYPMELEKVIIEKMPGIPVEVNNFGMGGWNSAELLINFMLDTIDTEPDIIVIYHAVRDLEPLLIPGFENDYSHARRNIGEVLWQYKLFSRIPSIPFSIYNFFCTQLFKTNIRYDLLRSIRKGEEDISLDFQGLHVYRRNIEHLINICKSNGIEVILGSVCNRIYESIKNDAKRMKYREGMMKINEIVESLAEKHGIAFVDNFRKMPDNEKYYLDDVHFTPLGMRELAKNFSEPIINIIPEILKKH